MQRKFEFLPEAVQVSLEHGEQPADIIPVLYDAAQVAHAKQVNSLLVVSGYGDPASAAAVSEALEAIHALGAQPPFRIAFVACMLPQFSVYHFAERYAQKLGIRAKVHVSTRDARAWLEVRAA